MDEEIKKQVMLAIDICIMITILLLLIFLLHRFLDLA